MQTDIASPRPALALSTSERAAANRAATRAGVAIDLIDAFSHRAMIGNAGMRLAAVVENIIAAIQGAAAPSEWPQIGEAVAEDIERRCSAPSAIAAVVGKVRPAVAAMGGDFRAAMLGTDAVGRGAGWNKTNNAVNYAEACHDAMHGRGHSSGEVFRALKDVVVAAVQVGLAPAEWRAAASAIGTEIRARMRV